MRSRAKSSDPVLGAYPDEGTRDVEKLVNRFDAARRASVRRLVTANPRVLDLAVTFPGALYVLAGRHGPQRRRQKALELVAAGAALKDVALALDLPLWLRRLPPEAFTGRLATLPKSDIFARRIANHLPTAAENSAFWLGSVAFGARACDDYFALWLAQQAIFMEPGDPETLFGLLAAYAWFSNVDLARASGLIVVPWRPEMALDTAVCAAKSWLNRMRLVLQLRAGMLTDPWLTPGEARGFSFLPLLDHGLGRRAFGLALGDEALRRLDGDLGAAQLRLGLPLAGDELGGVHLGQRLARRHEIAFADEDVAQAAAGFRGDVDVDRLEAAVAAGNAGGKAGIGIGAPGVVAAGRRGCNHGCDQPPPTQLHIDHSRVGARRTGRERPCRTPSAHGFGLPAAP